MFTAAMICSHPDAFASFVVMEAANDANALTCLKAGAPLPPVLLQNGLYDHSSTNKQMLASFPHMKSA